MLKVRVVFFAEKGSSPVLDWLETLPARVRAKALVRIERLAELGHELRRPEADYLSNGIYELRWRFQSVNYRILYFFHGREVAVLANGLTKEGAIPRSEIDSAAGRKARFENNPVSHTFVEE